MGELWQLCAIAGVVLWTIEIFIPFFLTDIFGTASLLVVPLAGVHNTKPGSHHATGFRADNYQLTT